MTIAEFFVNISVKGGEKAAKSVATVQSGLKEVQISGLAAKAAIVGVVYGLERLTSLVSARGMDLQQFAIFTGKSAEALQKWQYLGRQFGVTNEDMASSIKNVQTAMTNMLTKGTAPEGLNRLASKVNFDATKARDVFYVMEKLREFARVTADQPDLANQALRSFGLSDSTIAALRVSRVELDNISKSEIFSDKQTQALARVDVQFSNFWNRLKMMSGQNVVLFGGEAIKRLNDAVSSLKEAGVGLSKLIKLMPELGTAAKAMGLVLAAVFAPWTTAILGTIYLLSELQNKKSPLYKMVMGDAGKGVPQAKKDDGFGIGQLFKFKFIDDAARALLGPTEAEKARIYNSIVPRVPNSLTYGSGGKPQVTQNLNVNVRNDGVEDSEDATTLNMKTIQDAFRQFSVQNYGGG